MRIALTTMSVLLSTQAIAAEPFAGSWVREPGPDCTEDISMILSDTSMEGIETLCTLRVRSHDGARYDIVADCDGPEPGPPFQGRFTIEMMGTDSLVFSYEGDPTVIFYRCE